MAGNILYGKSRIELHVTLNILAYLIRRKNQIIHTIKY